MGEVHDRHMPGAISQPGSMGVSGATSKMVVASQENNKFPELTFTANMGEKKEQEGDRLKDLVQKREEALISSGGAPFTTLDDVEFARFRGAIISLAVDSSLKAR